MSLGCSAPDSSKKCQDDLTKDHFEYDELKEPYNYLKYDNPWWPKESTYPNIRVQTRVLDKSVNRISTRAGGLEFLFYEGLNPLPPHEPDSAPGKKRDESQSIGDQIKDQIKKEYQPPKYVPVNADKSHVLLQDRFGALLKFISGSVMLKSTSSLSIAAKQDFHEEVDGNYQKIVGRDTNEYRIGNSRFLFGKQDPTQLSLLKSIHDATVKIQQQRLKIITSESEDVSCPVCSAPLAVDMYSYTASGVGKRNSSSLQDYRCFDLNKAIILKCYNEFKFSHAARTSLTARLQAEGCGSLGCNVGKVKSYLKGIKKSEQFDEKAAEKLFDLIEKAEIGMNQGGDTSYGYAGDVTYRYGLFMNNMPSYTQIGYHLFPFKFELARNGTKQGTRAGLIYSTDGNAPKLIYAEPPVSGPGSVTIEVGQKLTTVVGLTYDLIVNSKINISGAGVEIAAVEGEMIISSNNVTSIRGDNILLDANGGIHIHTDSVMVAAAFNVTGDAAFKGHLTTDGAISTPYLIMPSMTQTSSWNGSSKAINHTAQWASQTECSFSLETKNNGCMTIYKLKDLKGHAAYTSAVTQLVNDLNAKYQLKFDWWQHWYGISLFAKEMAYISDVAAEPLEKWPTGIAKIEYPLWVKCFCYGMYKEANSEDNKNNPDWDEARDGMTWGHVLPGQQINVLNYKHHHKRWGDGHDHESSMPLGSYTQNTYEWGFERTAGSTGATPHPIKGDNIIYGRGSSGLFGA